MNTYLNLCTEVYEISKPYPPNDAYNFYKTYVENAKGLALEPMCGTGRFLIPMVQEGLIVHGFDSSDYMLKHLESKARDHNLKPKFWNGSAQSLNVQDRYDVIFIPSGSFCLIEDIEDVKLALSRFYNHLNDGGIFVFEVETHASVPDVGTCNGSIWHKSNGDKIVLSNFSTFEIDVLTSVGRYELVRHNKVIQTEVEELKIKIYERNYLINLLEDIGFENIKSFKAFDRNKKPDPQDESVVYECIK